MTPNGNFPKLGLLFWGPLSKDYSVLGSKIRYPPCLSSLSLDSWGDAMEKKIETTIMGYVGITIRIHSFIPR